MVSEEEQPDNPVAVAVIDVLGATGFGEREERDKLPVQETLETLIDEARSFIFVLPLPRLGVEEV